ncbi:MAG TPA: RNA polymerase subunit sigma [Planctomycetaceae bacterium]|nr:RNA polymerase subunit sigma [Planctomycetaceae bacterium]HRF01315.1 ECF-type sigma factor [Pirellulaceae bacterium]
MDEFDRLMTQLDAGDRAAASELLPLVYDELRRLAARQLADEPAGLTLQPTALVHEAFLRLVGNAGDRPIWNHRGHFFAAAARAMRRILVESARRRRRIKRGGDREREALGIDQIAAPPEREDLIALDEALDRLQEADPVAAELVQLRYFTGLSLAEAARLLELPQRTADRRWAYARAWLHRELAEASSDENPRGDESGGANRSSTAH